MSRKATVIIIVLLAASTIGWFEARRTGPSDLVLTGVVTTNDVIVSSQVGGRVRQLLVAEGATVAANQVIATLEQGELQADRAFYARSAEAVAAQVEASRAEIAAAVAQDSEARATLANAQRLFDRSQALLVGGGVSQQELDAARTTLSVAQARARAAERQVANRESALAASQQQQAAAAAQTAKANVRLTYSEITAPSAGVVDVRAARVGEVVTAGQPIVTLVNPDSLWVRADVEETYIDRVRIGDTLTVRLPSGAERKGTVIYRGVDADFATQRDVSRAKRDIKTFEIRLRVDNADRRLAVGMTSYVLLPTPRP
ncbi:MAG TPA: efflux RND transporter periplasmic adaptor subunit [Kofleriaceae bacterium]|nr:efflux RND transporter periplasmic adaptor subunit [Kofleriaceae bacterium]